MKYIIISDIHSNLETLHKVIDYFIPQLDIDAMVCLGDIVGYNADPSECLTRLLKSPGLTVIRGNHDRAIAYNDFKYFSEHAKAAGQWTREQLSIEELNKLSLVPQGPRIVDKLFAICHGSPEDEDTYILSPYDALSPFLWLRQMGLHVLFFGHTHMTETLICDRYDDLYNPRNIRRTTTKKFKIMDDTYYCINPGSLGQPRDSNPKASFAVFDTSEMEVEIIRFSYSIQKTQKKIRERGVPYGDFLGSRLMHGK
jgi:predicted phosphodiesterase